MIRKLVLLVSCIALCTTALSAEEKKLPPTGVLSSSGSSGYASQGTDIPWGSNVLSEDKPPIGGSVSRVVGNQWKMNVTNNSESKYRVNLKVIQYSDRGSRIKSDNFSMTLNPGESQERDVNGRNGTTRCTLELVSWKNLTPPKEETKEEAAESQSAQG